MAILITKDSKLQELLGEIIEIHGIYREINGAKRPGTFYPSGRASVGIENGPRLVLDYQDAGYRPKEELEKMRDQKVRVIGTYIGMQTLWGDGTQASIVAEVIENIQSIELLEE
jgi:hypothetical protein